MDLCFPFNNWDDFFFHVLVLFDQRFYSLFKIQTFLIKYSFFIQLFINVRLVFPQYLDGLCFLCLKNISTIFHFINLNWFKLRVSISSFIVVVTVRMSFSHSSLNILIFCACAFSIFWISTECLSFDFFSLFCYLLCNFFLSMANPPRSILEWFL